MATIKHTDWLNAMLGNPTHSVTDFDTNTIRVSLLDQTDSGTITAATVAYLAVNAATVVANSTVAVASISGGVVNLSGATTFLSVSGDSAEYLTVYKDSGTASTSPLVITWDSATTGIPVTPNGGDIVATWGSNVLVTLT